MYKPKVKICGLKRPEDIQIVNKYKPDFAGFVFAPSKRRVTPEYAKSLINNLDSSILRAGIFVNEEAAIAAEIAVYCGLDAIQLHGDEDNGYIKKLRDLLYNKYNYNKCNYNKCNKRGCSLHNTTDISQINSELSEMQNIPVTNKNIPGMDNSIPEIWKAVRVKDRESLNFLHKYQADAYVLDTYSEKAYGGTGNAFDWEIARGIAAEGIKIILAGGLNPQNIRRAIDIVMPFAVDVSSGVETNGCKDEEKVKEFIFMI